MHFSYVTALGIEERKAEDRELEDCFPLLHKQPPPFKFTFFGSLALWLWERKSTIFQNGQFIHGKTIQKLYFNEREDIKMMTIHIQMTKITGKGLFFYG